MGMFDDITCVPPTPCIKCREPITEGWQSKNGPCQLLQLPYWHVEYFYTSCEKCGAWNEYYLRKTVGPDYRPIQDYEQGGR
jgi:hypothetical protein